MLCQVAGDDTRRAPPPRSSDPRRPPIRRSAMVDERSQLGFFVAALGAAVLAVSVFLPWYGSASRADAALRRGHASWIRHSSVQSGAHRQPASARSGPDGQSLAGVPLGDLPRRPPAGTFPQDAQSAVEMLIIQRSQIAAFSVSRPLAACPDRPYIPSCAEHGAGVGRSSTGRSYEAARKGRSGKSTGAVDETATGSANFFGPPRPLRRRRSASSRIAAMHPPRPPSIDQGVIALIWAIGLGVVHLLRAPRRRRERRDGDRDLARLVRGDLAARAPARRGEAAAPAQPPALPRPYAARRPLLCGASAKTSLRASVVAELHLEPFARRDSLGSRLSRCAARSRAPR